MAGSVTPQEPGDSGSLTGYLGPPPPPWFAGNDCGPQTRYGIVAWLVPDTPKVACRYHDWHYRLIRIMREVRGGVPQARDALARYVAWLKSIQWLEGLDPMDVLDLHRRDADAFFRANVRRDYEAKKKVWIRRKLAPWIYWLGVRVGGGASA